MKKEIEISFDKQKYLFVVKVLMALFVSLSLLSLESINAFGKEVKEMKQEEVSTYAGQYDHYYTAATSDAKKVEWTTNQINVPLNSSTNISGQLKATPSVDRTIPVMGSNLKLRVGNTKVAVVEDYEVIPKSVGKTYLYASLNGKEVRVLLNVTKAEALYDEINFSQTKINMAKGEKINVSDYYARSVTPGDATNYSATYRVGNSSIASVDSKGNLTAKSVGNTWLYATTSTGNENRIMICVKKDSNLTSIAMPTEQSIPVYTENSVQYTVSPADATTTSIKWSTGNPSIATISKSGLITANKAGNTWIYAKYDDKEVKSLLRVLDTNQPTKVTFSVDEVSLEKGETNQITFQAYNSKGEKIDFSDYKKVVASVGNSKVASVDRYSNCLNISAKSVGNTWLNLEVNGFKTRILIRVNANKTYPVEAINSRTTLYTKSSLGVYDLFRYKENSVSVFLNPITLKVGNPNIAEVRDGQVIGLKAGKTYIYGNSGSYQAKVLLEVLDSTEIQSIKFNTSEVKIDVTKDSVQNIKVTTSPSTATDSNITFSVGNSSIASVDQYGNITGLSNGNTYVYATTRTGKSARALVKVTGFGTVQSVECEDEIKVDLNQNRYVNVSFALKTSNGYIASQFKDYYLTVGNSAIASISVNSYDNTVSAYVTCKAQGNTYVYLRDPSGTVIAKTMLRVGYDNLG